mgnify:FL=1
MIINGKKIDLRFSMRVIKEIQEHFGIKQFSEIPEFYLSISQDPFKVADFCIACVYYGCKDYESIEAVEDSIVKLEEIAPAASLFITAFNEFYGIKIDPSETKPDEEPGEVTAPNGGAN